MPDDLPKAIKILLWLLSGTIIFGVLLMKTTWLGSLAFLVVFFGLPVWINTRTNNKKNNP